MRQNPIAAMHQLCPELGDRVQAIEVRQLAVVDRQIDVKEMPRRLRHAVIDPAVQVDDGGDSLVENWLPILDGCRKKQPAVVIYLHDFFEDAHDECDLDKKFPNLNRGIETHRQKSRPPWVFPGNFGKCATLPTVTRRTIE